MMEQIIQLKEKHLKTDTSELKRLLLSRLEIIDEIKKHQNQQFNGKNFDIEEQTSTINYLVISYLSCYNKF